MKRKKHFKNSHHKFSDSRDLDSIVDLDTALSFGNSNSGFENLESINENVDSDQEHTLILDANNVNEVVTEVIDDDDVIYSGEEFDNGLIGTSSSDVISQHMNIREPLTTLKLLLENRLGVDLSDYDFWLQNAQMLDPQKNLVELCVQSEGLVQVNVEIIARDSVKKLNIVEVLKPADDVVEEPELGLPDTKLKNKKEIEHITKWIVDVEYRKEQEKLKIPMDPLEWRKDHVQHWMLWALQNFPFMSTKLDYWNISGAELCVMSHEEFRKKVSSDPGDLFWTHIELLRKCKFVAVIQGIPTNCFKKLSASSNISIQHLNKPSFKAYNKSLKLYPSMKLPAELAELPAGGQPGNRTGDITFYSRLIFCVGNNGQVQLWQFLLELLTDYTMTEIIQWIGDDGEFQLLNPEVVAHLWGQKKNKPQMNYEKLSRALRYYYDGDMISKVHGKRFAYKFVCDLKQLLGYSAGEIKRLVAECELRSLGRKQSLIDFTYD